MDNSIFIRYTACGYCAARQQSPSGYGGPRNPQPDRHVAHRLLAFLHRSSTASCTGKCQARWHQADNCRTASGTHRTTTRHRTATGQPVTEPPGTTAPSAPITRANAPHGRGTTAPPGTTPRGRHRTARHHPTVHHRTAGRHHTAGRRACGRPQDRLSPTDCRTPKRFTQGAAAAGARSHRDCRPDV